MKLFFWGTPISRYTDLFLYLAGPFSPTRKFEYYKTDPLLEYHFVLREQSMNIEFLHLGSAIFYKEAVFDLAIKDSEIFIFSFGFDSTSFSYEEQIYFLNTAISFKDILYPNKDMKLILVFFGFNKIEEVSFFDKIEFDKIDSFTKKKVLFIENLNDQGKSIDLLKEILFFTDN